VQIKWNIVWIVLIGTFLAACEEDISIKRNTEFQKQIVVNSIFYSDSTWAMRLTTSRDLLDPNDQIDQIKDAKVVILNRAGQTVCELYHAGAGLYLNTVVRPSPNSYYKVHIYSKKYGYVTAESTVPPRPVIENFEVTETTGQDSGHADVKFDIVQQNGTSNYYIWDVVYEVNTTNSNPNSSNLHFDVSQWVSDLNTNLGNVTPNRSKIYASSQDFVGGTNFTTLLTAPLTPGSVSDSNGGGGKGDGSVSPDTSIPSTPKPMLRIMSVSKELFNYFKSVEHYIRYQNVNSSLSEPAELYHNVEGGLGLFAGYSVLYVPIKD